MNMRRLLGVVFSLTIGAVVAAGPARANPLRPANDYFQNATVVTSLTFSDTTGLFATDEPGEPRACVNIGNTVWYRLTPGEDGIVSVRADSTFSTRYAAIYIGSQIDTLETINCGSTWAGVSFAARAGETYYIQIGGGDGSAGTANLVMETVGGVAGRVTNHLGEPIGGHCVGLFEENPYWPSRVTNAFYPDSFDHPMAPRVAGSYLFSHVPEGEYKIAFHCYGAYNYEEEWYDGKPSFTSADPITIQEGEGVLGIDGQLIPSSSISGIITDEAGIPAATCVEAFDENAEFSGWSYSNETGYYNLRVTAGSHRIRFGCWQGRFAQEYYDNKSSLEAADPVDIATGERITGIDAVLDIKGQISGLITTTDGSPMPNECVAVRDQSGNSSGYTTTHPDGTYSVYVPTGSFIIQLGCSLSDYRQEFFDDKPDAESADLVEVTSPNKTSGINAILSRYPSPANDDRANAEDMGSAPTSLSGSTRSATTEEQESTSCDWPDRSVWYRYTPNSTQDVFLRTDTFADLTVFLDRDPTNTSTAASQTIACGVSGGFGYVAGFRALAGETYLVRVSSYWPTDFTLSLEAGRDAETTVFEAPTPCAVLCPYWNQTRSAAEDFEASCAPEPDAPEGSWDEIEVTVPQGNDDEVPTHLLFHIEPELDFDAWLCRKVADSNGYYVSHAANVVLQPCSTAYTFGCFENGTVSVTPGTTYVLRVYNWSDRSESPGGYSFLYQKPFGPAINPVPIPEG